MHFSDEMYGKTARTYHSWIFLCHTRIFKLLRKQATGRKMALVCEKTRDKNVCSLEQTVFVLLNDKSRMKGDFHVRFREKFEVKVLLLTRLRGRLINYRKEKK